MDFNSKRENKNENKKENNHKNGTQYTITTRILNAIHIAILFVPVFIFLLPRRIINKYFKRYLKGILLFYILIPLHWPFFNDACLFTKISMDLGDYSEAKTTSQFSEENMMWLYEPVMRFFGWKFNSNGMNKVVTLHSIINILLVLSLL